VKDEIGKAKLFDRGAPTPRVVFATKALRVDVAKLLKDGRWPAFDPRTTVLLDAAEPAAAEAPSLTKTGQASVAIQSYRNAEVIVEARSDAGGFVVLHDVDHPWWRAEVDGAEAPILRANVMFRAVAVGPGAHRVRFVFRPFQGLARDVSAWPLAALDRLVALVDKALGKPPADAKPVSGKSIPAAR
jgi:hypothetical protein